MDKSIFDIEEELNKLPKRPGVYIMHDSDDVIIYVGKAVNLRNRVRSYFRESTKKTVKIDQMVKHIAWFEYTVVDSELEALVLENNLIKENQPKYNTMLKDDKTYPYIKVTVADDFPRIVMCRRVTKDNAKYFGPFTSGEAVRETIDLLRRVYKVRSCRMSIQEKQVKTKSGVPGERKCLYYHMGQCLGPCDGLVKKDEYDGNIARVIDFLNGDHRQVIDDLKNKMQAASEQMEYERAGEYRDLIESVRKVSEKQKITDIGKDNRDVIAIARGDGSVIVQMFFIRDGRLIGREHYYMEHTDRESSEDILSAFLMQYYLGAPFIPGEILMPFEPSQAELISEWMSSQRGSKVSFTVPQKGRKEKLLMLAQENARIKLEKDVEKLKRNRERTVGAVEELGDILGISGIVRMEAYDISNISGFESVGSMVVYEEGSPRPNEYRKFRIKSVEGPNDYASMEEVLTRRFEHGLAERDLEDGTGKFSRFPDLILMDGGRGQVNICREVLERLGLSIPVCGMVKDDNHRTRGLYYDNRELPISHSSEAFLLITRIQDEAHRFAITFHRSLRRKSSTRSVLDDIPGIGPSRRKALMKAFESIEDIKNATEEELKQVDGLNASAAKSVYDHFHK
ncbi:MAG: excinuclease ABC subunit UvrC [Lachnospiraceae bacterium]|nr:excinuclease ABC subunit UvrC [Lachnospiraceae bacterium]